MKYIIPLCILFSLILFSCNDDDNVIPFEFDPDVMHYDGANNTAPFFRQGTSEAAAEFPSEVTTQYAGEKIEAVQLYIYDIPESCALVIYDAGQNGAPGSELMEVDIKPELSANKWNTIVLPNLLDIPASGLWISVRSTHPGLLQVLGCDAGPAKEGADWLYESGDNTWRTFRVRSGDNINWNIRAMISQ